MSERTIPRNSTYDVATSKLLSDGKDITNTYGILSLTVTRQVNRVPIATIICKDGSAADETFSISDGSDLIPGKEIEIAVGYDGKDQTIFKGLIVKHTLKVATNGDSQLILHCQDVATKLTIGRHSRYFTNVTDSEAIEEILNTYSNLNSTIESTSFNHPEMVQYYSTDWDFILSRAEMNGKIVLAENGTLKVKSPNTSSTDLISLTYGANLLEFEAEIDARFQYKSVKAKAWNYTDQELVVAESSEPSINNQGNLSGTNLAEVIGLNEWELKHTGQVAEQELKAWADAQLLKSRLSKIQGRVKIKGYPEAKPDAVIELLGVGGRFNGKAYVSGIRHELSEGAWHTYMQVGLPPKWFYKEEDIVEKVASGLVPGVNGLQIGIVVQLQNDPKGEDRILVKVPIDAQSEGIWARVATLDAGENRGSFFRPELEDEVVLGFLNDDPRDPIVIGMLNSSAKPAPLAASDNNHHKGFVTRSELKVMFDDEQKIITLETPGGNKITISDQDKGIKLEDQNSNTVTMNDSGITIQSSKDITLEARGTLTLKATQNAACEAMNVNLKANAQFKAEGSGSAEVSTGGVAILKGSSVLIN